MKKVTKLAVLIMAGLTVGCANTNTSTQNSHMASNVKVLWQDLDTFSDIEPGTKNKQNFRNQLTREFEISFSALAQRLPKGHKLYVQVNDINLAGKISDVYRADRGALRVYDTWYHPHVTITYRVKNAKGEFVAAQDNLKLDTPHKGQYPAAHFMLRSFAYEKYLIKSWFNHQLLPYIEAPTHTAGL
jgi:hypothetical protein